MVALSRKISIRRICFLLCLCGAADFALASGYFAANILLSVNVRDRFFDAAVVFNHRDGSLHGMDQVTFAGVSKALELYRERRVGRIICVGGSRPDLHPPVAKRMAAYLLSNGVPAHVLQHDMNSYDTISNLESVGSFVTQTDKEYLFISNITHGLRLQYFGRKLPIKASFVGSERLSLSLIADLPFYYIGVHKELSSFFARLILGDEIYRDIIRRIRQS